MGNQVDVQVLDNDGDPMSGVKVTIAIGGWMSGGTIEEYTDDDGRAEFETSQDYESHRDFWIHVRGQTFGPYHIWGGAFTVQLD
jgi:hypothetical protein